MDEREGAVTFKGKPLTTLGATLQEGSVAPDVTMQSGPLNTFHLIGDTERKIRLVSVVPCIETGVCETQTFRVNRKAANFDDDRVIAITISSDLTETQWRWCGQNGVEHIKMLSDHMDMAFGAAYGTWIKELRKEQRAMFVIDADGIVRYAEYVPEVGHHPNYEAAFAVVESLLTGEEIASRSPGAGTDIRQVRDFCAVAERPDPTTFFDWVTIPAGPFLLGSDKQKDPLAWDDDQPQQVMTLPEFQIARIPVTNIQYKKFVEATGYPAPSHWIDGVIPAGKENHPVVEVNWYDALSFCAWAGVRLPTEVEWEKAARGTDGRIFPWGDQKPNPRLGNFSFNVGGTTPVGQYPDGASPYGLLDVAGNVWEWTTSKEWPYPYDATDGREDFDGDDRRLLRGGAFRTVNPTRCAYRGSGTLSHYHSNYDGFRVARSATT
jgi:formylglycine-generating enzyme required for sulfatase activity